MENSMEIPQKTKNKIKLLYNPAILVQGIYLDKAIIQKDTWTPTQPIHSVAALFTTAEALQQPKCLWTDE